MLINLVLIMLIIVVCTVLKNILLLDRFVAETDDNNTLKGTKGGIGGSYGMGAFRPRKDKTIPDIPISVDACVGKGRSQVVAFDNTGNATQALMNGMIYVGYSFAWTGTYQNTLENGDLVRTFTQLQQEQVVQKLLQKPSVISAFQARDIIDGLSRIGINLEATKLKLIKLQDSSNQTDPYIYTQTTYFAIQVDEGGAPQYLVYNNGSLSRVDSLPNDIYSNVNGNLQYCFKMETVPSWIGRSPTSLFRIAAVNTSKYLYHSETTGTLTTGQYSDAKYTWWHGMFFSGNGDDATNLTKIEDVPGVDNPGGDAGSSSDPGASSPIDISTRNSCSGTLLSGCLVNIAGIPIRFIKIKDRNNDNTIRYGQTFFMMQASNGNYYTHLPTYPKPTLTSFQVFPIEPADPQNIAGNINANKKFLFRILAKDGAKDGDSVDIDTAYFKILPFLENKQQVNMCINNGKLGVGPDSFQWRKYGFVFM